MTQTTDIIIVGGGIIGISTALELQSRHPKMHIIVLEKESAPATHQSSHNSGVIHAGVYYAPHSLKAKFCRLGVQATHDFCMEHNLPIQRTGKLIVAIDDAEYTRMQALGEQAKQNGIPIENISETDLRTMEPHIKGIGALYSPTTGITDYRAITEMADIFISRGGKIVYGELVVSGTETPHHVSVTTHTTTYQCDRVITCAGLYSDRIIRSFGHDPKYRIVPFRGEFSAC